MSACLCRTLEIKSLTIAAEQDSGHTGRKPCTATVMSKAAFTPHRNATQRRTMHGAAGRNARMTSESGRRAETSTSVGTGLYPHMPILRPHAARYSTNGASLA